MKLGPTLAEMTKPWTIEPSVRAEALAVKRIDPLAPANLYNITWYDADDRICHFVVPPELTGVDAPIVVLYAKEFPTGSHKVGAAYAVLAELIVEGVVSPDRHTLVWPSTGNYGVGGAWVGGRMGCRSVVVLPEGMSDERFELIESLGAEVVRTPGTESNVKEIYDKTHELAADPSVRVLNQFEVMGNYRFHYAVTGNTVIELAKRLEEQRIGNARIAAFVSAMGSAGTISAGDRLKQAWPDLRIVGLEPIQCPTLFNNGHGAHEIQGIGDKHVTWIHNVSNMDALMCVDDMDCVRGLQLLTDEIGGRVLQDRLGISHEATAMLASIFGISGVCNLLGAIKTARYFRLDKKDVIVTVCTDDIGRYRSVMTSLTRKEGEMDESVALARLESIFHGAGLDWIQEGTVPNRDRWHNLKYYTWVEQQGKTVEELDPQRDPEWWLSHQAKIPELDEAIKARR
ncbi:MAG TPA: pyridoxal-phosphate dependent enzyme [Vicinamibacteria bacterium]|nr:pyridoxal-phosphate dependent enzyme [Vicinamibacteria bacterium]